MGTLIAIGIEVTIGFGVIIARGVENAIIIGLKATPIADIVRVTRNPLRIPGAREIPDQSVAANALIPVQLMNSK